MTNYPSKPRQTALQQQMQVADNNAEFTQNVKNIQQSLVDQKYLLSQYVTGVMDKNTIDALKLAVTTGEQKTDLPASESKTLEMYKEISNDFEKVKKPTAEQKENLNVKVGGYKKAIDDLLAQEKAAAEEFARKKAEKDAEDKRLAEEKAKKDAENEKKSALEKFLDMIVSILKGTFGQEAKSGTALGGENAKTASEKKEILEQIQKDPNAVKAAVNAGLDEYVKKHDYNEFKDLSKNNFKGLKVKFKGSNGAEAELDMNLLPADELKTAKAAFDDYASKLNAESYAALKPATEERNFIADAVIRKGGIMSANEKVVVSRLYDIYKDADQQQKSEIVNLLQDPKSSLSKFVDKVSKPGDMFANMSALGQEVLEGKTTLAEYDIQVELRIKADKGEDTKALKDGFKKERENLVAYKDASRSVSDLGSNSTTYAAEKVEINIGKAENAMYTELELIKVKYDNLLTEATAEADLAKFSVDFDNEKLKLKKKYGDKLTDETVDKTFADTDIEAQRKLNAMKNASTALDSKEFDSRYNFDKQLLRDDRAEDNRKFQVSQTIKGYSNELTVELMKLDQQNETAKRAHETLVTAISNDDDRVNPNTGKVEGRQNDEKLKAEAIAKTQKAIDKINADANQAIANAQADYEKEQAAEATRREVFRIKEKAGTAFKATEEIRRGKWEELHKDDKKDLKDFIAKTRDDADTLIEAEEDKLYGSYRKRKENGKIAITNGKSTILTGAIPQIDIDAAERRGRSKADIIDAEAAEKVRLQDFEAKYLAFKDNGGTVKDKNGVDKLVLGENQIDNVKKAEQLAQNAYNIARNEKIAVEEGREQLADVTNKQQKKELKANLNNATDNLFFEANLQNADALKKNDDDKRATNQEIAANKIKGQQVVADAGHFLNVEEMNKSQAVAMQKLNIDLKDHEFAVQAAEAWGGNQVTLKMDDDGKLTMETIKDGALLPGVIAQQVSRQDTLGFLSSPTTFSNESITYTLPENLSLQGLKDNLANNVKPGQQR